MYVCTYEVKENIHTHILFYFPSSRLLCLSPAETECMSVIQNLRLPVWQHPYTLLLLKIFRLNSHTPDLMVRPLHVQVLP